MEYISGGLFKSEEEWKHPRRVIDSNEIIYVVKGEVFIQEEDTKYHLLPGEVLLLESGKTHFGTEASSDTKFYWLHFQGKCNFKYVKSVGENLKVSVRQLLHYANTPVYPKEIMNLMMEVVIMEISIYNSEQADASDMISSEVKEWIRINSDKKLSASDVAQHFGYNSDYLCRKFKACYGIAIKQYIQKQRCEYIKALLISSDKNINEIASMAGFSNYQTFLKFFTYHENISPTGFRNTYCNIHTNKN